METENTDVKNTEFLSAELSSVSESIKSMSKVVENIRRKLDKMYNTIDYKIDEKLNMLKETLVKECDLKDKVKLIVDEYLQNKVNNSSKFLDLVIKIATIVTPILLVLYGSR